MIKNILITGVAGFIGSTLAEKLLQSTPHKIIGLDNMVNGSETNLSYLKNYKNFLFHKTDICDYSSIEFLMQENDIQCVFHMAALVSVQESIQAPLRSSSINVQGTLNILEACRKNDVKKLIFSSSAAVYGNDPQLPKDEQSTTSPISPYGYEKLMGEYYMKLYHELYGVDTVVLRYFNVYGKRQNVRSDYSGVITKFITNFEKNETSTIYGNGSQYRDFVHVDDVVRANIAAMYTPNIGGEIFCVGTAQKTTINNLFNLLNLKYKKRFLPNYLPMMPGDIKASVCDNTKIRDVLKIDNFIFFEEGIMKL